MPIGVGTPFLGAACLPTTSINPYAWCGRRADTSRFWYPPTYCGTCFLIRERYTRSARLGIHGRSNGGLLVGAALTQRPELFGVALPAVGVLDMLRYHTASANARQWSSDYGLSEDAQQFKALYSYSPYHNVKQATCYPPTLVTTADHDDRVVPWHSFKFTAALQAAQACRWKACLAQ